MAMAKAMTVDCKMFRSDQVRTIFATKEYWWMSPLPQFNKIAHRALMLILLQLCYWPSFWHNCSHRNKVHRPTTATSWKEARSARARLSRFDQHPVSFARSAISDFSFFNMLQSIFVKQLCNCPPSSLSEQPPSTLSMPWIELTSKSIKNRTPNSPPPLFFGAAGHDELCCCGCAWPSDPPASLLGIWLDGPMRIQLQFALPLPLFPCPIQPSCTWVK